MSDTYRHKAMRALKNQIVDRKEELGLESSVKLSCPTEGFSDQELMETLHKFWEGSMRHGNKRKSEALVKVKKRRSEKRTQRQLFKTGRDE